VPTLKFFCFALITLSTSMVTNIAAQHALPPKTKDALEAKLASIARILTEQQQQQHIPGLAFSIVGNDTVVYTQVPGQRDLEKRLPVTPNTAFRIGSCTKAFTSMAVALGQDKGLLSLDDHPRKYLSYFQMADPVADANFA
jgi:CubicO group peptidase (beta-lactamase class C family)